MAPLSIFLLLLLSSIWGSSFLFMRIAAPDFGAVPLIMGRVGIAALCLLPFFLMSKDRKLTRGHNHKLLLLGLLNCSIPFALFAFATLSLEAGVTALLNATAPIFTALVAAIFFGQLLKRETIVGALFAFAGVAVLSWDRMSFKEGGSGWAIVAGVLASLCYGIASNYSKHNFQHMPPVLLTSVSILWGALAMIPPGLALWPETMPPLSAWLCVLALGTVCTAFGYYVYYYLIANNSVTAASSVSFLVPVFANIWGWIFLHEHVTMRVLAGMALTLLGTSLVTGILKLSKPLPPKPLPDVPA